MAAPANKEPLTQMPIDPCDRPAYTAAQLDDYFEKIKLPKHHRSSPLRANKSLAVSKAEALPFLKVLHRHHLANLRFDNLDVHYSVEKRVSLNTNDLFEKFVNKSRGGRCMEHNTFFGTVLRSLGFEVRNCAGRVSRMMSPSKDVRQNQGQTYDPWNHMLNLVRLDGESWVVDVGMGAMGPGIVYPLEDGFEGEAIAPRRIRLQLRSIPENASLQQENAQKLWCYDVCHQKTDGASHWIPAYCFTKTEFLPQDYEAMSWFTSTHPKSFFTRDIVVTRLDVDEDEQAIIGDVTLFNDQLRQTVRGQRSIMREGLTEVERLDVLEETFGAKFTDEEKRSITVARLS